MTNKPLTLDRLHALHAAVSFEYMIRADAFARRNLVRHLTMINQAIERMTDDMQIDR